MKEYKRRLKKVTKHFEALRVLTTSVETNHSIQGKIEEDLDTAQAAVNRLQAVSLG